MHSVHESLLGDDAAARNNGRQSTINRISMLVAQRLSVVGMEEEVRHGSVAGASVNTLCNVIGAGVLSLPLAMHEASIVGGFTLMLFMALLGGLAAFMVIMGCEATQRFSFAEVVAHALFPSYTFEDFCTKVGKLALHDLGCVGGGAMETEELHRKHKEREAVSRRKRRAVIVLLELLVFINNYGTLIIYSRVIGDSIPPVVSSLLHTSGIIVTRTFWLVTSGVIFFLLSCVRHMDELKWTSFLGFITILYIVVIVVVRYVTSLQNPPYPDVDPAALEGINWCKISVNILRSVSTYSIAFSYHSNIPYFYRELRNRKPHTMLKSVYIAFPIVTVCYATTGFFGYLTFGTLVASPAAGGDIVRNYPADDLLVNIGRFGLFLHFACVYPILSVCARRGLHRVIMHALTWNRLSTPDEEDETPPANETTKYYSTDHRYKMSGGSDELPLSDDADRDVGSPEDTTTLAIVLEALFIVCTSVVLAAYISGISVVIDFLGTLLGTVMMFTVPGFTGWCILSRASPLGGSTVVSHTRLFMVLTFLLVVMGIACTSLGLLFLIKQYVLPAL